MDGLEGLYRFAAFEPAARASFARVARLVGRALDVDEVVLAFGQPGHVLVRAFDADGRPVEAERVDADALVAHSTPRLDGLRLSVPLRAAGEAIGALGVASAEPRRWSRSEIELLGGLADGLVGELELRVQVLRLEEKQAYLASEKEVLQQVASGADLVEIAGSLAQYVERQSPGSLCLVRLGGHRGGDEGLAAPTLPEPFVVEYCALDSAELPDTPPDAGRIVSIPDLTGPGSDAPALRALAHAHDLRAWWSASLGGGPGHWGCIDVLRSIPGDPAAEDLEVLAVAATIGRLAIERARAEKDLRRREEYFRSLIEKAADLTIVLNRDGTARYLSPRAEAVFGPIAGVRLIDRILPGDREHVTGLLRRLERMGDPLSFEFRVEAGGETRYLGATASNLLDNPSIQGIVVNARDLTDRKAAEDALRLSEERYRLVSRATSDVIWDWDPVSGEVVWTASMEKIFGYAPEAIEGSFAWWESRIHPEDRPTASQRAHEAIDSGGAEYADEYRFLRADGSYAVVEDRGLIFRDDAGAPVRVVGTIVDVTHRRELEAQLRHAQRMEAVGQLAGGVAHDFNNMLTAILGFARLLVDEVREEGEGRDFLDEIVAATDRASALTRQLLAFSRRQVLQPRSVDLNATIESMQPMLRRLIGENMVIEAKLDPAIASVWADEGQVEQVILNLVVNARDAMQDGGVLRIGTVPVPPDQVPAVEGEERLTRPCVRLTVEDTGCGMPPDVLERIFEPFFTTKGPSAGTGLGLATVYGIVRQSGGHVLVRSEVDVGSTFVIYLPVTAPDARERTDGGVGSDASSAGRVLIVDDDEGLRDLAGRVLRNGGYDVRTAEHGDQALELVRGSFEPDLLLTDVVLPRMDGPRVAARVTELVPGVRTLFMTGYVGHQLAAGSLPDPEVSLLEKPFSAAALLQLVDEMLDRPRAAVGSLEQVGT